MADHADAGLVGAVIAVQTERAMADITFGDIDHLAPREIAELLDRLFACTLPPHDVHGRPTIVQLPRHEIERRFGRA